MDPQQVAALEAWLAGYKASNTTPLVTPPHGPGGTFNTPGLERGIVNAMLQPLPGFWGFLEARGHVRRSRETSPIFGILTGQTASSGAEPTAACAPGRTPGNLKLCQQTWSYGQLTMQSQVIRLQDAGQIVNRGESLDLQLIGNPFADLPEPVALTPQQLFISRWAKAVVELTTAIRRDYCGLVFTGNPANTAGSEGYIEFNGLDRIINTGYRDSISLQACPAADSLVVTSLSGLNIQTNGSTYVDVLVEAYDQQAYLAQRTFLGDVEFAFVMRRGAFRALTEIWPCTYRTYRCDLSGNDQARVNLDGNAMAEMVVEMRNGQFLYIDGKKVPVILDDCLAETFINNTLPGGGLNESDIYLVPLRSPAFTDTDGQITYLDYFDYGAPGAAGDIISQAGWGAYARLSTDRRYLVLTEPPTRGCFQIQMFTRPRLICRAPFLAARFPDVRYQKRFNERSPFPGNPYNLNGGTYSFAGQTVNSPLA